MLAASKELSIKSEAETCFHKHRRKRGRTGCNNEKIKSLPKKKRQKVALPYSPIFLHVSQKIYLVVMHKTQHRDSY